MTDSTNLVKWHADRKTGGTGIDIDGKGQDATKPIHAGDRLELLENSALSWWECRSSGAAAADDVVVPVQQALDNAGDQNLRWHKVGASGGSSGKTLWMPYMTLDASITTEEYRFDLGASEVLTLSHIEATLKGGGTNTDVTLDIYDNTAGSAIASVTAGSKSTSSVSSNTGAEILIRLTNAGATRAEVGYLLQLEVA